jgi:hypothetical protein
MIVYQPSIRGLALGMLVLACGGLLEKNGNMRSTGEAGDREATKRIGDVLAQSLEPWLWHAREP